jgi:hypothetical protein
MTRLDIFELETTCNDVCCALSERVWRRRHILKNFARIT